MWIKYIVCSLAKSCILRISSKNKLIGYVQNCIFDQPKLQNAYVIWKIQKTRLLIIIKRHPKILEATLWKIEWRRVSKLLWRAMFLALRSKIEVKWWRAIMTMMAMINKRYPSWLAAKGIKTIWASMIVLMMIEIAFTISVYILAY